MEKNSKIKEFVKRNWLWIIIVLILLSMLFNSYRNNNITKNDTVTYKTVNTKKEAVQEMKVPDTIVKNFTKIKTITKYVEKVKVDTLEIVYRDTVEVKFERIGSVNTKEYSFDYKSNNNGLKIANFSLEDSVTVITGQKRKWFLGKAENTVDVYHSNKYVESANIKHIDVTPKKRFYETTLFKFAVGFGAGILILK